MEIHVLKLYFRKRGFRFALCEIVMDDGRSVELLALDLDMRKPPLLSIEWVS